MGLITKEVEVKITARNKTHYEELGYGILKCNDIIMVKVEDLPKATLTKIICCCDYCMCEYTTTYDHYYNVMHSTVPKCCCYNCKSKKIKESNLITYGVESTNSIPEIREKQKNTNLKKYGTDNPFGNQEIKEKIKQTLLDKYGYDHPSKVEEIQNKAKQTCLEKYGYENVLQSPLIREKIKQTMINNLGVEHPIQSEFIHDKIKNTTLERYGVENVLQSDDVRHKIRNTMIKRYGVEFASQSPEIKKKINQTFYKNQSVCTSTQQLYISNLFCLPINYPICYWNVDMYDEHNNIVLEIDGGGHDLSVKTGSITQEAFDNKERIREIIIRRSGYKLCRIKSKKDNYPSDDILLQMYDFSKQYFSDYPNHSWITFDIDEGVVRNAENLNGVLFDFGELRKITKADLDSA